MPPQSVAERLADWSSRLQAADVPADVRSLAVDHLVDTVGVCIAGSATPVARAARAAMLGGSVGASGVFGERTRTGAVAAALMNGTAAHALDFDDNCYAGFVHGSAVILPAALAVSEQQGALASALVTAFIAGSECEYAVGAACDNLLYDDGWWTTGVLGPIGACVAACRLLGLDAGQTASALGLAVAGTGGLKVCFGTDAKPLLAGAASAAGTTAALLAHEGVRGPVDAFESTRGFIERFNRGTFRHALLDGLGTHWSLRSPGVDIKRIPVCLSSHAAVDSVMAIVAAHGIGRDDIAHIACDVPPIVVANLVHRTPRTPQQAQFSMPFAIAASLKFGDLGLKHLGAGVVDDAALAPLMSRVDMHSSARWADPRRRVDAPEGAHVTVTLHDGRSFDAFRASARGSAASRLTTAELDAKFLDCVGPVTGDGSAARLLRRWRAVDSGGSVTALLAPD